jgi:glutathione S-transferase
MDLGESQREESKNIVSSELDWVDSLLADGRDYLVGDRFSHADIAVASILSPLVLPPKHPVYHRMKHPPAMARDLENWKHRPSIAWVRAIYAKHR